MGTTTPARASRRPLARALRWGVVTVAVLLVLRVAFIEQFVVSTGSMAPLILGVHRKCDCPKCGFPVVVGAPHDGSAPDHYSGVKCPNCGAGDLGLENLPDQPGQRLWVDKTAYEWRAPRRWELAVFRGPDDRSPLYVKRVVGLPGETVQVNDGDVYIDGELCQRPPEVRRLSSVLLYDMKHKGGLCWSWRDKPIGIPEIGLHTGTLSDPLTFRATSPLYSSQLGDYWVYNGARVNRIESTSSLWVTAEMSFIQEGYVLIGLACGGRTTSALFGALGNRPDNLNGLPRHDFAKLDFQVTPRKDSRFELNLGTKQSSLSIDGVLIASVDVPAPPYGPAVPDGLSIWMHRADIGLLDIRIYRDVHYQSAGRHGIKSPCRLGPDEYFMLGDNSADSDDSRFWPEPGVPASRLIGRPMFLKRG